MSAARRPSVKRVREPLDCDPAHGILTWRPRPDCPAFKFAGRRAAPQFPPGTPSLGAGAVYAPAIIDR
jgi:hypothetical protein